MIKTEYDLVFVKHARYIQSAKVSLRRSIYLDGQLISTQIASGVYRGVSGNTTIGYSIDRRQASTTFPGNDLGLSVLIIFLSHTLS